MDVTQAPKPRPHSAWIMVLEQPPASRDVVWLAKANVSPIAAVFAHGALGLAAAALFLALTRHGPALPALLALVALTLLLSLDRTLEARCLGLSTQLALLGAVTIAGRPYLYVALVLLQAAYATHFQAARVVRFPRSLRDVRRRAA